MKYKSIGTDKYSEHWSFDGHAYIAIPKEFTKQIRHEEREHIKQTILIRLVPYLTDEQREKLVDILKDLDGV